LTVDDLSFIPGDIASIHRMAGDASTRLYHRLIFSDNATCVVMQAHDSDAITHFVEMTAVMERLGVDAPKLLGSEGNLLAVEDCGDLSFQERLDSCGAGERLALYRRIIDDLMDFQERAIHVTKRREPCFSLAFDIPKLTFEIDFCREHFIENHCALPMSATARNNLSELWAPLIIELAAAPKTLCHRDFHSRNILVTGERLVWIDYQDARMGAPQYDLVSLLHDPYVALPVAETEILADYYYENSPSTQTDRPAFARLYDYAALQRLYKALGTFGYQTAVRGVEDYRSSIPPALKTFRRILAKRTELRPLHDTLDAIGFPA